MHRGSGTRGGREGIELNERDKEGRGREKRRERGDWGWSEGGRKGGIREGWKEDGHP